MLFPEKSDKAKFVWIDLKNVNTDGWKKKWAEPYVATPYASSLHIDCAGHSISIL
jgi:hypothetical protein